MGRYFGREPRYSREEIEAQAKQAVEAQIGRGRPPEDDWQPLEARLAAADREMQARPLPDVVPAPQPTRTAVGATTPPA